MRIWNGNIDVSCGIEGKEEAPWVILSHSLGSCMEMWGPQMGDMGRHFRVLRYDTRGHGGSEATPPPYTLEGLAADAVGLMDALNIAEAHWVGISMGGMIGQAMALGYPRRLRSLALCDTAAIVSAEAQSVWEERIDRVRSLGMASVVEETLSRWFTPPFLAKPPPEVERIRAHLLKTPVEGYIGCSEAIRRLNYLPRLPEIRIPTLILVGDQDPGTPVGASLAMHERIPGSRLVVLPEAAHLSNIEQAEAFTRNLLDFLLGLPG